MKLKRFRLGRFGVLSATMKLMLNHADCYPAVYSTTQTPATLLTSVALAILHQNFQALFDSGCIHHIIKEQAYSWTYYPEGALLAGTASSRTLTTKARGFMKL